MKTRAQDGPDSPTLEELLGFAAKAGLAEVVWEKGDRRVAFKRSSAPAAGSAERGHAEEASVPVPSGPVPVVVKSPMVGTFLRAPKGRPPMASENDTVAPGQKMGIVEAMLVPKDVVSSVKGRVLRVLVENGRVVEYGQPLFEIEPVEGGGHV